MKRNIVNRLCTTAFLLAGMASAAPVLAESTGTNFIGAPNFMDVFKIRCPAKSLGLTANISDLPFIGNETAVHLTMLKDITVGGAADGTEDNIPSGRAVLDSGPGNYYLVYRLSDRAGTTLADDYTSDISCRNVNGVLIPSVPGSFRRIVNQ